MHCLQHCSAVSRLPTGVHLCRTLHSREVLYCYTLASLYLLSKDARTVANKYVPTRYKLKQSTFHSALLFWSGQSIRHPPQYYYSDGDRLIIITLVFTKYISSTIRIFRNNLYLHGIMNINLVYSCCSSCCGALSAVRACELQNRDTLQKQQS